MLAAMAQSAAPESGERYAQGVVEIVAPDLEAMLSFYTSLGFGIERRTGDFAVVAGFGVRLFLAGNARAPTDKRWASLRIMTPDVDAVWRCVEALGVEIGNTVGDRSYGLRDFNVVDPAGFELRFAQPLP
jgi:catechol 2,3-dioxygenase-like lactoylglutathione lyase family enzyme